MNRWKLEITGERETFSGNNWLVADCGVTDHNDRFIHVYVTTDHVHASEVDGDALSDGCLIALAPELKDAVARLHHQLHGCAVSACKEPECLARDIAIRAEQIIDDAVSEAAKS